jgi:DNA (cytosine-5)-methyltransferase 1
MVALIQSFPSEWEFSGGKTAAYRQVGNAFPPLVARAVGLAIRRAFNRQRGPIAANGHGTEMRLFDARRSLAGARRTPKVKNR